MIIEGFLEELLNSPILFEAAFVLLGVYAVLMIAAEWRLFTKAGEKGWKSLIPFYSVFVSHHIIGMRHIWFILDIVFWLSELALEIVKAPLWVEETFFALAILFTIVSEIIHIMKLCYCYTKSELFGIGLFVVPPLFLMILAFGKSEYNPPRSHRKHN